LVEKGVIRLSLRHRRRLLLQRSAHLGFPMPQTIDLEGNDALTVQLIKSRAEALLGAGPGLRAP
jgi:hypothetical protein